MSAYVCVCVSGKHAEPLLTVLTLLLLEEHLCQSSLLKLASMKRIKNSYQTASIVRKVWKGLQTSKKKSGHLIPWLLSNLSCRCLGKNLVSCIIYPAPVWDWQDKRRVFLYLSRSFNCTVISHAYRHFIALSLDDIS